MTTRISDRLARKGNPSVFVYILICLVGIVGILALWLFVAESDATTAMSYEEQVDDDQRFTGAGTIADGIADGTREGLRTGTTAAGLVDASESSDLVTHLLEPGDTGYTSNPRDPLEQLSELRDRYKEGEIRN